MSSQLLKLPKKSENLDCALHPFTPKYAIHENYTNREIYGTPFEEPVENKFGFKEIFIDEYYHQKAPGRIELFDLNKAYPRRGYKLKDSHLEYWTKIQIKNKPLDEFNKVVDEAKYMLDLNEGWDDGEAKKIDITLFNLACKCVSNYIESIYLDKYLIIASPVIDPVADGSIDFTWQLEKARMLINFKQVGDRIIGYFYGDLRNNELPIKGNVPTDKVYEHLMKWMQNLK